MYAYNIYVNMYVNICTHAHTYLCMYICISDSTRIHTYIYIYSYVNIYIYAYMYVFIYASNTYIYSIHTIYQIVCIYTDICRCIYIYICSYIYVYVHVFTCLYCIDRCRLCCPSASEFRFGQDVTHRFLDDAGLALCLPGSPVSCRQSEVRAQNPYWDHRVTLASRNTKNGYGGFV